MSFLSIITYLPIIKILVSDFADSLDKLFLAFNFYEFSKWNSKKVIILSK